MDCYKCKQPIASKDRTCRHCGTDNGYPNVRQASRAEERTALLARLRKAEGLAKNNGTQKVLNDFGEAVKSSRAVIARPITDVMQLVMQAQFSYSSWQKRVDAGLEVPRDNEFDEARVQFENLLFPNFAKEIVFASLSLSGRGISGYGAYILELKEMMIEERATVFEENPVNFCKKNKIQATDILPAGYRALWSERDILAKAKLYELLLPDTSQEDFLKIIQRDGGGTDNSDFIEVHIYGAITKPAIEKLFVPNATSEADEAIKSWIVDQLKEIDFEVEMI